MRVAAALAAYALLLAAVAPAVLRRGWTSRAPRLAIAAWLTTSTAFVLALVLGGLVLAVPTPNLAEGLAGLLRSCVEAVRAAYATPARALSAGAGLTLAVAVIGRVAWCLARALRTVTTRRREHVAILNLVGRDDLTLGATLLDAAAVAIYCLPGRRRRIVITTAALAALTPDELTAALAHERAHLVGRHHLVLAAADSLAAALPRIPLLAASRVEIARLVEMLADDAASRRHHPRTVAAALVALASATAPEETLAAGGPPALARVHRLLTPNAPLGRGRTSVGALLLTAVLALPLGAAAMPAVTIVGLGYCPVPADATTHLG